MDQPFFTKPRRHGQAIGAAVIVSPKASRATYGVSIMEPWSLPRPLAGSSPGPDMLDDAGPAR